MRKYNKSIRKEAIIIETIETVNPRILVLKKIYDETKESCVFGNLLYRYPKSETDFNKVLEDSNISIQNYEASYKRCIEKNDLYYSDDDCTNSYHLYNIIDNLIIDKMYLLDDILNIDTCFYRYLSAPLVNYYREITSKLERSNDTIERFIAHETIAIEQDSGIFYPCDEEKLRLLAIEYIREKNNCSKDAINEIIAEIKSKWVD